MFLINNINNLKEKNRIFFAKDRGKYNKIRAIICRSARGEWLAGWQSGQAAPGWLVAITKLLRGWLSSSLALCPAGGRWGWVPQVHPGSCQAPTKPPWILSACPRTHRKPEAVHGLQAASEVWDAFSAERRLQRADKSPLWHFGIWMLIF